MKLGSEVKLRKAGGEVLDAKCLVIHSKEGEVVDLLVYAPNADGDDPHRLMSVPPSVGPESAGWFKE